MPFNFSALFQSFHTSKNSQIHQQLCNWFSAHYYMQSPSALCDPLIGSSIKLDWTYGMTGSYGMLYILWCYFAYRTQRTFEIKFIFPGEYVLQIYSICLSFSVDEKVQLLYVLLNFWKVVQNRENELFLSLENLDYKGIL